MTEAELRRFAKEQQSRIEGLVAEVKALEAEIKRLRGTAISRDYHTGSFLPCERACCAVARVLPSMEESHG